MINLKDEIFNEILNRNFAIVYLHWEWSRQSDVGIEIAKYWQKQWNCLEKNNQVEIYILIPDKSEIVASWLTAECKRTSLPLHGGGHGSLLWLHFGKVINHILYLHQNTINVITDINKQLLQ